MSIIAGLGDMSLWLVDLNLKLRGPSTIVILMERFIFNIESFFQGSSKPAFPLLICISSCTLIPYQATVIFDHFDETVPYEVRLR